MDMKELFGDVIASYSRAQAIEDGVLVDVSESKEYRELGFRFPIALTRAVWDKYVEVPAAVPCQSIAGRLWDVLYMFRWAIGRSGGRSEFICKLAVQNDYRKAAKTVRLKAHCGPGDNAEPVITIMLPEED